MGFSGAPRRIVITGWGAVTPLGLTVEDTWSAMLHGESGIAELTTVDTKGLPVDFALTPGEAHDNRLCSVLVRALAGA